MPERLTDLLLQWAFLALAWTLFALYAVIAALGAAGWASTGFSGSVAAWYCAAVMAIHAGGAAYTRHWIGRAAAETGR